MTKKVLYPGSFDPMTNGHLDVINRASQMFDEVIVCVANNISKNSLFTVDERVEMIEEVVKNIPNVKVDKFDGLLADYVNSNNIDVVVRGLRANMDFEYEIQIFQMNSHLFNKGVDTIFLMTSPQYSFISSSTIKEVLSFEGKVDGFLPESVLKKAQEKFKMIRESKK